MIVVIFSYFILGSQWPWLASPYKYNTNNVSSKQLKTKWYQNQKMGNKLVGITVDRGGQHNTERNVYFLVTKTKTKH